MNLSDKRLDPIGKSLCSLVAACFSSMDAGCRMRNPTLVQNPSALKVFDIRPKGLKDAIERALHNENREFAETSWSDHSPPPERSSRGRRAPWNPARGLAYSARIRHAGSGLCSHSTDWRSERLVLRGFPVVVARFSGPSGRGRRNAARPTQRSDSGGGRCAGFLASGSV